jgi:hypothetical protein
MHHTTQTPVIPIEARHALSWPLLPWLANGTLRGAELEATRTHARHCSACRRELARLEFLSQRLKALGRDERCEDALHRLHERIDLPQRRAPALPWASAAVLVLACGLVGTLMQSAESNVAWLRKIGLTMLPQTQPMASGRAPLTARLVFYDNVTEGQLRSVLLSVGADLVDGPTARGVYTIVIHRTAASGEAASALSHLRHSRKVVYVEPTLAHTVSDLGD